MLIFFGDVYFDKSISNAHLSVRKAKMLIACQNSTFLAFVSIFFLILALLIGRISEECTPATSSLKIASLNLSSLSYIIFAMIRSRE